MPLSQAATPAVTAAPSSAEAISFGVAVETQAELLWRLMGEAIAKGSCFGAWAPGIQGSESAA